MLRTTRGLLRLAAAGTVAGVAALAAPSIAAAATSTSAVTGVAASNLSVGITTAAAFGTTLSAGAAPTTSAVLAITDSSSTPTLDINDTTSTTANAGYLQAAATGCTGSESKLANPLNVTSVSGTGWTQYASTTFPFGVSATSTEVATASAPVAASAVTVAYKQTIGSTEVLTTGCNYSDTITYTIS